MRKFPVNRGVNAGLSTLTVAKMMGVSQKTAGKRLKKMMLELDNDLSLYDIGKLIYEAHKTKSRNSLRSFIDAFD